MKFQRGFTVIDLLSTIAIMVILAAIAIPSYLKLQCRERVKELGIDDTICKTYEGRHEISRKWENNDYEIQYVDYGTTEEQSAKLYCDTSQFTAKYDEIVNRYDKLILECQQKLLVCENQPICLHNNTEIK